MIAQDTLLVILVKLVDQIPMPPPPPKRGRGHPKVYPDRLFLKALVIMIIRRLHKVHELLTVLEQPTSDADLAGIADRERALPFATDLGTAIESHPGGLAGADWLPGAHFGCFDPAVGALRPDGGD